MSDRVAVLEARIEELENQLAAARGPAPRPPTRKCWKCRLGIRNHHKYHWIETPEGVPTVEHWNCDDPESYRPPKEEVE